MKHTLWLYSFLLRLCLASGVDTNLTLASKCVEMYRCRFEEPKSVYCVNLTLTVVPPCMENIEMLDMTENSLSIVSSRDFPDIMDSLEVVILRNTLLKVVVECAFINLPKLRELDLSQNLIRTISNLTFINNILLERLNLSANRIKKLDASQFVLSKLRILDMSDGFLESIEEAAFSKTPTLEWLNLRDNKLKILSLKNDIPTILVGGSNPWYCDCNFLSLSKKVDSKIDKNFTCVDMDRNRRSWTEIIFIETDCQQLKKVTDMYDRSAKSDNSTALIIDVYGYLFVGISMLVILCCCCGSNTKKSNEETNKFEFTRPSSAAEGKKAYTEALVTIEGSSKN